MLAVDEAVAIVTSGFGPLPAEQISLTAALGRVLAEDVVARIDQPPMDVSAMDGYAVRLADTVKCPAQLTIIGESAAGAPFQGAPGTGEAVRISTGAVLPAGADAIVIQENTRRNGNLVEVHQPTVRGQWIRPAGLDFRAGDTLLRANSVLSARNIGLAAAMNVPWLKVRRRPRIAFAATGDELSMPGDPLADGGIVSANGPALAAYIACFGGEPIDLGIARDDEAALRTVLEGARGADLLVTTGGASVGDHDLVRRVIGPDGLQLGFYKVAMRPGKPLIFGRLGATPVLGLPGNPVSVGVTALLFLRPAVNVMLSLPAGQPAETAVLAVDLPANDERQDYLRAAIAPGSDGEPVVTPFPRQDSSMLRVFADAQCLILRAPRAPAAAAGTRVPILRFPAADGGF